MLDPNTDLFGKPLKGLEREEIKTEEEMRDMCRMLLEEVPHTRELYTIFFNFEDILGWSRKMADAIFDRPKLFFDTFKKAFRDMGLDARIYNLPRSLVMTIEKLRDSLGETLVSIEGRIVALSPVRPFIKKANYECPACGSVISVKLDERFVNNDIKEPTKCSCGWKGGFALSSEETTNRATIFLEDLQEKTDNPYSQRLSAFLEGSLVEPDFIKNLTPGSEVRVVGILHIKSHRRQRSVNSWKHFELEVNHIEPLDKEVDISNLSDKDIEKIKEVAKEIDERGLDVLTSSFAPSIYGYERIKEALVLQICASRNIPGEKPIRNKPNILLIGDPGSAKSLLGDFVVRVNPGSRKAVGGGSSAVGLTASIVKEDESMGYRVEPGALILARDILFLDELNNLNEEDKPKLQEGLSEQSVTINKATLHVRLKVTAGVLACANPKRGHFDKTEKYLSQFDIPSPIINRFDLVFVLADEMDRQRDEKIVERMVDRERGSIVPDFDEDFLRKFFTYIKIQPEPILDKEIERKIKEVYTKARDKRSENLLINPRFVESLLRLLKASAKIRMSQKIEEKDLERVLKILNESHYQKDQYEKFGL